MVPWRTSPNSATRGSCPSQTLPQAWTGLTWSMQHGPLKVTSLAEAAGPSCDPLPLILLFLLLILLLRLLFAAWCACVCTSLRCTCERACMRRMASALRLRFLWCLLSAFGCDLWESGCFSHLCSKLYCDSHPVLKNEPSSLSPETDSRRSHAASAFTAGTFSINLTAWKFGVISALLVAFCL